VYAFESPFTVSLFSIYVDSKKDSPVNGGVLDYPNGQ